MAVRIPVNGPEVGHVAHPVDILRHDGQALEKKLIIRVMAKNYFLRLVPNNKILSKINRIKL